MMRRLFPVLGALLLAGCQPGPPAPANQYRRAEYIPPLPLWFAPGGTWLSASDASRLQALAPRLPVDLVPEFYAAGPLAQARAQRVGGQLGRPVRLLAAVGFAPEQTALVIRMPPGIIADACRGAGVRELDGSWPGADGTAPLLLPPGCATAAAIQAQVTDPADLLRGQPLPPAAAWPYAAAIERYYQRNDPPQSSGAQSTAQGGGGGSGGQDQTAAASGQGAAGANPLLGPLPH